MAGLYTVKHMDKERLDRIKKMLTVRPEKMQYRGGRMRMVKGKRIKLYHISGDKIYIPYAIGRKLDIGDKIESSKEEMDMSIDITLRPNQEIAAAQAMKELMERGSVSLALYTGFGKTLLSLYLAIQLKLPILILCVGNTLKRSWTTTIDTYMDENRWVIGEECPEACPIVICPMDRFDKMPIDYARRFGTLIIDEVHEMCTPTRAPNIIKLTPRYIIACTATPNRRMDGMDVIHRSICGKRYVTSPDARPLKIFKVNTGIYPDYKKGSWESLLTSIYRNKNRNRQIISMVKANMHKKMLILTWRKYHAKILFDILEKEGVRCDVLMGNKSEYNDSKVLIGTVKKIGTGFDEKTTCTNFGGSRIDLVFFLCTTRSSILILQGVGRGRRSEDPSVVYLLDECSTLQSHWSCFRSCFPDAEYTHCESKDICKPLI